MAKTTLILLLCLLLTSNLVLGQESICNSACTACTNGACTGPCGANSSAISIGARSTCSCNNQFYLGVGGCLACHISCTQCSRGGANNCITCPGGNQLQADYTCAMAVPVPATIPDPPTILRGNSNYKAELIHNVLYITFDFPNRTENEKKVLLDYRTNTFQLLNPDLTIQNEYLATRRQITFEKKNGIVSYQITPVNFDGAKGKRLLVFFSQPTRLLQPLVDDALRVLQEVEPSLDGRSLQATASDTSNKSIQFPTMFFNRDTTTMVLYVMIYHIFSIISLICSIYLIFVKPFFPGLRKSVRCFWIAQNVAYFNYLSLFGFLATFYYLEADYILYFFSMTSLRFFGLDFTFFTNFEEQKDKIGIFQGKVSNIWYRPISGGGVANVIEDPMLLNRYFIHMILYFLAVILSFVPPVKEIFSWMRLGCTVSFGPHLAYLGTLSIFQFFLAPSSESSFTMWISMILGFLMVIFVLLDVAMMKVQAGSQDGKSFYGYPKTKGALYFDILGYTGHKKLRDYRPFPVGEFEVLIVSCIVFAIIGKYQTTQNIICGCLVLVLIASNVLMPQFKLMKFLKLGLNVLILGFWVMSLLIGISPQAEVSNAKLMFTLLLAFYGAALCFNLLLLIYRIIDLLMDSPSTYGENAKPVPQQKAYTRVTSTKSLI